MHLQYLGISSLLSDVKIPDTVKCKENLSSNKNLKRIKSLNCLKPTVFVCVQSILAKELRL